MKCELKLKNCAKIANNCTRGIHFCRQCRDEMLGIAPKESSNDPCDKSKLQD